MDEQQQDPTQVRVVIPAPRGGSKHRIPGRRRECETLDRLISNLWAGGTQMLVVRGDEGVGKTALLDYLGEQAVGCRVVRAVGVKSERELAFAGLHQLCAPFLGGLDHLPEPQRDVLATVFGLRPGESPDGFVIGMAVMGLLTAAAKDRPLLCILKDAQWLDDASARTLGFVARRFTGTPVAIAISVRHDSESPDLTGVPELVVPGLSEEDALALLRSSVAGPFDARVQERIATEARGNPLTLKQATNGDGPNELAGGFGLPRLAMPIELERTFRRQLAPLPASTRQLLLLAAAEPTGDAVLLWAAANQLGIGASAAKPAEAMRLIELDGHVSFCHPLLRSHIYQAASPAARRAVHRVLADVTDPNTDPDRRAWHRGHAASNADESAATELELNADRAQERGGLPAGSAFRARAAELTVDPGHRARRALTAAVMSHQAGSWGPARRLLAMAQAGPLDERHAARAQLLGAQLVARSARGPDTSMLLLEAAVRLAPDQSGLARQAYGEAINAALTAGRLGSPNAVGVALAVRAAHGLRSPDVPGLLLEAASVMVSEGHTSGAPLVKQALRSFHNQRTQSHDGLHWLPLACRMAQELWDDETWHSMSTWLIASARRAGALASLPDALNSGAVIQLLTAGCDLAVPMAEEADAVGQATRNYAGPYGRLMCAAWGGSLTETSRLIDVATTKLVARGEGAWLTAAYVATAVVNNGLGRYDAALAAADLGSEIPEELGFSTWALVELIEAAVRVGAPERAALALKRLSVRTDASATDWALGITDRSRALLTQGETAESLYRAAIEKLGRTLVRADLGRAHLLYGEWLRRKGRRIDARQQLRTANEILVQLGFDGFAERARRELLSTGGSLRRQATVQDRLLTDQETQIARLARDGRTNSEIGVELYISPRTVEWHLGHVFMKLSISSRRELSQALPG